MIVYGTRATLLKSEYFFEPCPNCKATNSVQISIFGRYAHIFWIPFFPIGKKGVSVCSNCKQVLKDKDMPDSLKLSYDNLKAHTKTPVWNFSGLGIVALVAIGLTISENHKNDKIGRYLAAPKKGDVFQLKFNDTVYTLYQVAKVDPDTVFFFSGKYQTNTETGLDDLEAKGFDTDSVEGVSKGALAAMHKKDDIIDIVRK
jgi:hypothetical protein